MKWDLYKFQLKSIGTLKLSVSAGYSTKVLGVKFCLDKNLRLKIFHNNVARNQVVTFYLPNDVFVIYRNIDNDTVEFKFELMMNKKVLLTVSKINGKRQSMSDWLLMIIRIGLKFV